MDTGKLRAELLREQLLALREYVAVEGRCLTPLDRLHLAQASCLLLEAARVEEGRPGEISVVRSVTSLEDALAVLSEENQEAEET